MAAPKGNKYGKKNKGKANGRPALFKPEYAKAIVEFFNIDPLRQEVAEQSVEYFASGKLKRKSEKLRYIPNKLPTLYGFSEKIGVSYVSVYRWAEKGQWYEQDGGYDKDGKPLINKAEPPKDFKVFCNAYKAAKELQKEFLISIGLNGAAPSAFAIFTAKNVTDMRDRVEQDITSGGKPITKINYIVPEDPKKKKAKEENDDEESI